MKISLHVCKVDVSAVEKVCRVTLGLKRLGYRRQMSAFLGHLHNRCCGLSQISAQRGNDAAVGTETACVAVAEPDALVGKTAQIWRNALESAEFIDHVRAESLHYDYHHIWSAGCQNRVLLAWQGGEKAVERLLSLIFGQKIELRCKILVLAKRCKEAEYRIHGRMVQIFVLRKINAANV